MSSTQQSIKHEIITYTNSKGVTATYDTSSTGVEQKVGQKDAKKLIALGIFPFGKHATTGKPYLNACGGKSRDISKGFFIKGDYCDKEGCSHHKDTAGARPFDRKYAKATHYGATCVGGKSEGKVRELGASTGVSLSNVPEKRKKRFFSYLKFVLEKRSGVENGQVFAYDKAKDGMKKMCDGALGKVKVQVATITKACILYKYKGADGKEESNDSGGFKEMTTKQIFTDFYKNAGKVLYEVEEEEDDEDEEDWFSNGETTEESGSEMGEEEADAVEAVLEEHEIAEAQLAHENEMEEQKAKDIAEYEAEEKAMEEEEQTEKKPDGRTKEGKALKLAQLTAGN